MSRIEPWSYDADRITVRDDWKNAVVTNAAIDTFLQGRDKFFLVAAKGFGKTLLLKTKSKLFRDGERAANFYPREDLCEKIGHPTSESTFSYEDLAGFVQRTTWRALWEAIILVVVARTIGLELPSSVADLVRDADTATDLLSIFLRHRNNFTRNASVVTDALRPLVRRATGSVALFFDNVDEALDEHIGQSLLATRGERPVSEHVWINAQLGLMDAAKDVHFLNRHVQVFATVRVEAFRQSQTSLTLQLKDYCTLLGYTRDELRTIFENNITLMRPQDLMKSRTTGLMEQLVGFATLEHAFARHNKRRRTEDVFDYIHRHTFGRPRELVAMGDKISQIHVQERTPVKVASEVNAYSTELLRQYKMEVVPYFDEVEYACLCEEVQANVLSQAEVERISGRIATQSGYDHVFCSMYRKGLLGTVKKGHDRRWTQVFLPVAEHIFEKDGCLPTSPYYLMHPALEDDLRRRHPHFTYDRSNIIGNGYEFSPPRGRSPTSRNTQPDVDDSAEHVRPWSGVPAPPSRPSASAPARRRSNGEGPGPVPRLPPPALAREQQAGGSGRPVFVSYSRRDKKWLGEMKTMLAPVMRSSVFDLWDDTRIKPGDDFRREISRALGAARVAVLLVSEAFLESEFIARYEFLQCLEAAARGGVRLIWVLLEACMYDRTPIAKLQAAHDVKRPITTLKRAARKLEWKNVCDVIVEATDPLHPRG